MLTWYCCAFYEHNCPCCIKELSSLNATSRMDIDYVDIVKILAYPSKMFLPAGKYNDTFHSTLPFPLLLLYPIPSSDYGGMYLSISEDYIGNLNWWEKKFPCHNIHVFNIHFSSSRQNTNCVRAKLVKDKQTHFSSVSSSIASFQKHLYT